MDIRIRALVLGFFFLAVGIRSAAQVPDSDIALRANELLDSMKYYKLTNPARTIQIGEAFLSQVPEKGNERYHFLVAVECANGEKMLSRMDRALNYCDRSVRLARFLGTKELIYAYFSKAAVFNVNEVIDSTIIYYQKVIELSPPGESSFYLCNAYTGIGTVYWVLENDQKAEEYLLKGVECSRGQSETIRSFAIAPILQFYLQKEDKRYLAYLDSLTATDFFSKTSHEALMSHFDQFLLLGDLPKDGIEQRLMQVYRYHADNQRPLDAQVFFVTMLASHLYDVGKETTADHFLKEVLARTREQGRVGLEARILNMLYTHCKETRDLQCALEYSEQLLNANKQILEDQNRNTVHELNIRFETAQKDHQISEQNILLEQGRRNRYFLIALSTLGLALTFLTFLYLRYRIQVAKRLEEQRKQLHEQEIAHLRKEKEYAELTTALQARVHERNRIARDLHDEVGSALSSIHVYSSAAEKALQVSPSVATDILKQISINSRQVMENMSDIVWAINTGSDGQLSLEDKLKNYGYELLTPLGINCTYMIDAEAEKKLQNIEARKNILLIAKEAMNNIAKYSSAADASIGLSLQNGSLELEIQDNGKGFSPTAKKGGNGLRNMQLRTEDLGGRFQLVSAEHRGTQIHCEIPLTSIRDMHSHDHP